MIRRVRRTTNRREEVETQTLTVEKPYRALVYHGHHSSRTAIVQSLRLSTLPTTNTSGSSVLEAPPSWQRNVGLASRTKTALTSLRQNRREQLKKSSLFLPDSVFNYIMCYVPPYRYCMKLVYS